MNHVTDKIVSKVEEGTKHLDSELQEVSRSIIEGNTKKVDDMATILQENQHQILEEQCEHFNSTLNWIDNKIMKKEDANIILQEQENNFNKALNLIMNSFNGLTREIPSIKKSNSFND
jgi:uncharacterized membrane-anchored protein